jgi:hypothetical protein
LAIQIEFGIKTFYKIESFNPRTGKITPLSGWFGNTVLDSGRNQMSQQPWFTSCQVGNNSTAPQQTDTGLLGYVDGTTDTVADDHGAQGSAPHYGWRRKVFQFDPGAIGGQNLAEVGIGWGTSGATIATRALIEDVGGSQITITPLADEFLWVTAEVRYYPPTGDVTGTVTLNSVVYNYIFRAAEVTNTTWWGSRIGEAIGQYSAANTDWIAYDGLLGTVEQAPSGLSAPCDNQDQTNLPYSNNSYEQKMQCNCGAGSGIGNAWNLTNGIRSILISTTAGRYQTQFGEDPGALGNPIPKDDTFTMEMVWLLNWVEEVIP